MPANLMVLRGSAVVPRVAVGLPKLLGATWDWLDCRLETLSRLGQKRRQELVMALQSDDVYRSRLRKYWFSVRCDVSAQKTGRRFRDCA